MIKRRSNRDFPSGPVVRASPSNAGGGGHGFDTWLGSWDPTCLMARKPKHRGSVVRNSVKTLKVVHVKKKILKKKEGATKETEKQNESEGRAQIN